MTQLEDHLNEIQPYKNINSSKATLEEKDITGRGSKAETLKEKGPQSCLSLLSTLPELGTFPPHFVLVLMVLWEY